MDNHVKPCINTQTSPSNSQTKLNLKEKLLESKKHNNTNPPNPSHTLNITVIDQNLTPTNIQNKAIETLPTKTFAETTANETGNLPKLNQAIVFKTIDGIKQIDYIIAISKITSPKNIISASRISNNRFCIFLTSETIADNLIKEHTHIIVNDIEIPIRKLITPFKRIILANVYPIIPNSLILEALQKEGIKTTSPITTIKAGYAHTSNEFAHIGSFKRQTYIHPDDITKLPSSILIYFEETNYRIFITDDSITCFLCKQTGHLSSSCKRFSETVNSNPKIIYNESPALTSTLNLESIRTNSFKSNENLITLDPITNTDNITSTIMDIQEHQDTNKRPAPESTCPSSPRLPSTNSPKITEKIEHNSKNDHIKNKTIKKPKIRSRSNSSTRSMDKLEDQLKPAINIFHQNKDLNLNSSTFKFIVENFSNKNINIHDLCEQVGTNTTDLSNIIEKVRPALTDRSIKSKITKLSNLLFQSMPPSKDNHSSSI